MRQVIFNIEDEDVALNFYKWMLQVGFKVFEQETLASLTISPKEGKLVCDVKTTASNRQDNWSVLPSYRDNVIFQNPSLSQVYLDSIENLQNPNTESQARSA